MGDDLEEEVRRGVKLGNGGVVLFRKLGMLRSDEEAWVGIDQ